MSRALDIAAAAVTVQLRSRGRVPVDYISDPNGFASDRLGLFLWSKQREILDSVTVNRHTAVRACHDSGKSMVASVAAAWWLTVHPPGSAFVVSTAPSWTQIRAILWREINRRHREGSLPGRMNQSEWFINNELVGMGRRPPDWDTSAFQGIHSEHVLVIIDEADGVPESIFNAVETITTNEKCRILAIGNPDNPQSYFSGRQRPGTGWHTIHIDGFETPNFTDEAIPETLRPLLLSPIWVDERKAEWGEDSPLYVAKVRGEYAMDADSGVVPLSWVRECQRPELVDSDLLERFFTDQFDVAARLEIVKTQDSTTLRALAELPDATEAMKETIGVTLAERDTPVELGVDVGAGGDETVIVERRGKYVGKVWAYKTPDVTQAVGHVMEAIRETGATQVKIDAIGVGWGVVGRLRELQREGLHKATIASINVSNPSATPDKFPSLRSELWWQVGRELSRTHGWDLTAADDTTINQLIAPKYMLDSAGRIRVEPKQDTIKRLGNSPDRADALLLAFYRPREVRMRWLT